MKEGNTAWSEQLRAVLVSPLHERGIGWQIALLLLLPLAVLHSFFMYLRRALLRHRALLGVADVAIRRDTAAIIAVGNLCVGGSGKSPLVRALASACLKQGYAVCVLSRGYGAAGGKHGVFLHRRESSELPSAEGVVRRLGHSDLADELRELVVFLQLTESGRSRVENALPPLLIAQNPKRREGLVESLMVLREMGQQSALGSQDKGVIVLLDDGLQHLQCPRDLEICVWPYSATVHAPRLPLPVGYYREGLWRGLNRIASTYPVHVWNGVPRGQSAAMERMGPFAKDVCHFGMEMLLRWFDSSMQLVDFAKSLEGSIPLVVTGIAAPHRFVQSFQAATGAEHLGGKTVCIHFRDHGPFESEVVRRAIGGERFVLIVTLKDWCRWSGNKEFEDFVSTGSVIIGVAEAVLSGFTSSRKSSVDRAAAGSDSIAAELVQRALEARKTRLLALHRNEAD